MAELAAEAHARLEQNPIVFAQHEVIRSAPRLCGWCQRREGPHAHREHRPCTFYGCECFCRSVIPEETQQAITQPIETLLFGEDPRDGSGVRDAISQDPGLAGLLEGL